MSRSDKLAVVSNRIGVFPLVGDKEMGVFSFDDNDGVNVSDDVNFTPRVISP